MTLQELYDNLYDGSTPRYARLFIESYEKNYVLISNADLMNLTDYEYAMWLTADYAMLLEDKGYLKKGNEYLDKSITLFENHPKYQKGKLFEIQYYESLKFHKARGLYYLKKYNESLSVFKELDRAFPNNDKYLGWVNGVKNKSIDRLTWIAFGIMISIFVLKSFLDGKNIIFDRTSYWIEFASFLFFIVCFILNLIQRIRQRKINAT